MSQKFQTEALLIQAQYRLRWGVLVLSAMLVLAGSAMVFLMPQGTPFDWIIQIPHTSAKITNASSGVVFATMGMLLALAAATRKIG